MHSNSCIIFIASHHAAVSSVRVAVLPEQSLQVSWQPALDMDNNDKTVVTVTTVFSSDIQSVNTMPPDSMVRISGLPEYSTGEVRVQTKNPSAMSEVTTVGVRTVTANTTNTNGELCSFLGIQFDRILVTPRQQLVH